MDSVPNFRKKHDAKQKKKDKGPIFASQKHVRIELENQWRHEKKKCVAKVHTSTVGWPGYENDLRITTHGKRSREIIQ